MKKTLVALAALAATGAFAQSTVTISGRMDAGVVYSSNVQPGAATLSIARGNNNRINFDVTEDLGGGMAATVALGLRFEPNTGNPESNGRPLFQGESRVGLKGNFGWIRLGRGLPATQWYNGGIIDPWGVTTVAGSVYAPGFATDYVPGGEGRTDGIFYDSPNMGGFNFAFTYSPRKVGTSNPAVVAPAAPTSWSKTFTSVAIAYMNGPINAMLGYEQNRYGDSLLNLGGNYDMGSAKLFAGYGAVKGGSAADRFGIAGGASTAATASMAASAAASTYNGYVTAATGNGRLVSPNETITVWSIGATVPMGAAKFLVGYSSFSSDNAGALNQNGQTWQRDSKLGVGVNYALSKRTYVYSDLASTTRNNNSNAVVNNPALDNSRVTNFDLGIAHAF